VRRVVVKPPSFPEAAENAQLTPEADRVWQVLCGDHGHWRAGIYSPEQSSAADCAELERHTCPELFLLLDGAVTLLLSEDGELREQPLEPGKPVLVTAPHTGFCPKGPHTGRAFVVERDQFETEYRTPENW